MIGGRLSKLRKEKKMTQEEISKKLGIPRSTYSNYESGKREPDFNTAELIAEFLDVSIDYLIGRTNDRNTTLSEPSRILLDSLDLSDEEIINNLPLEIDGRKLTEEEYKWFIASVRAKREMEGR